MKSDERGVVLQERHGLVREMQHRDADFLRHGHHLQPEADAGMREPTGQRHRRAVGAPAGRARHRAVVVELDRVHAAADGRHLHHVMAERAQFCAGAFGNRLLDLERVALGPDPRRLHRLLQAHAVIDQIDQRLHRAREDALSAGQAERINKLALAQRHHGRHRGGDALARRQRQRVAGPRIVQVHVVVRDGAEPGDQDFCAEQIVDGLRGRDHVAEGVGRGHVRGVGAFELLDARAPFLRAVVSMARRRSFA